MHEVRADQSCAAEAEDPEESRRNIMNDLEQTIACGELYVEAGQAYTPVCSDPVLCL